MSDLVHQRPDSRWFDRSHCTARCKARSSSAWNLKTSRKARSVSSEVSFENTESHAASPLARLGHPHRSRTAVFLCRSVFPGLFGKKWAEAFGGLSPPGRHRWSRRHEQAVSMARNALFLGSPKIRAFLEILPGCFRRKLRNERFTGSSTWNQLPPETVLRSNTRRLGKQLDGWKYSQQKKQESDSRCGSSTASLSSHDRRDHDPNHRQEFSFTRYGRMFLRSIKFPQDRMASDKDRFSRPTGRDMSPRAKTSVSDCRSGDSVGAYRGLKGRDNGYPGLSGLNAVDD